MLVKVEFPREKETGGGEGGNCVVAKARLTVC